MIQSNNITTASKQAEQPRELTTTEMKAIAGGGAGGTLIPIKVKHNV